ncbi:type VI secretion system tube protein Hcp [Roseomonas rosulenta]|uniref:type VI secretion system tube protein Hcp n=1 Tax=Roseomonas rosulenta TaxID=2748667 RepID=UPI0018E03E24|nr:type VI secretion system tube protein Hcp [Roseomonas rosulenta]
MSETAIYLSYSGVTGESDLPSDTVPSGPGPKWSPLLSCTLTAAVNVQGRSIKGGATSIVDFGGDAPPVLVTKRTDGATVGLMREVLASTKQASATIVFTRTDAGMPTEYLRYNLDGCSIVGFEMHGIGADRATEDFKILYRRMTIIAFGGTHGAKGAQSSAVLINGA